MYLANVLGSVVATLKDPSLEARPLLVIQPVTPSGARQGGPLVAVDAVGVGVGERVLWVRSRESSFAFLPDVVASDASIVGRVDRMDLCGGSSSARSEAAPSRSSSPARRSVKK